MIKISLLVGVPLLLTFPLGDLQLGSEIVGVAGVGGEADIVGVGWGRREKME